MTINMLCNTEIEIYNMHVEELRETLDIVYDELLGADPDDIAAE